MTNVYLLTPILLIIALLFIIIKTDSQKAKKKV